MYKNNPIMMLLGSGLVVLGIHAVIACNEQDLQNLLGILNAECQLLNELTIVINDKGIPCGSFIGREQASLQPSFQYQYVQSHKTYTLLLVVMEVPEQEYTYVPMPVRLERVETGIQGSNIISGYKVKWRETSCTVGCNNDLHMKYMFLLFEEPDYFPGYINRQILDLWGFMNEYDMCNPFASSEFDVLSFYKTCPCVTG